MKKTKLTPKQIVDLSFKNTEVLLNALKTDIAFSNYNCWGTKTVLRVVENLLTTFKEEKTSFILLSEELEDVPLSRLAFKETEAKLVAWKGRIDGSDWRVKTILSRLSDTSERLFVDKNNFVKLWEGG